MPCQYSSYPDPRKLKIKRAEIRQALLAKGLVEGTGKYSEVFNRKFLKAQKHCW